MYQQTQMKKRKEPVFKIGSFFLNRTYFPDSEDLKVVITYIPIYPALFTFYLPLQNSPVTHSQLPIISLGSFYFFLGSSKFTIHSFTITSHLPWLYLLFHWLFSLFPWHFKIHHSLIPIHHHLPWLFLIFPLLSQIHHSLIHHSPFTITSLDSPHLK